MVIRQAGLIASIMKLTFEQAQRKYRDDEIGELASSAEGLRFLLLKTLDRPEYEAQLAKSAGITEDRVPGTSRLEYFFSSDWATNDIKACITRIHAEERQKRRAGEEQLVAELYKMQSFDWGDLRQGALEKTIVDQYVKKIRDFSALNESVDNKLLNSMRGYVQCSWYNHWTSILIEDIFKDQPGVIPALGLVKKVDLFIDDVPFDLKVTYLPEQFVKEYRKSKKLKPEVSLLKKLAKQKKLPFDETLSETRLLEHLWSILKDDPDPQAKTSLAELHSVRKQLVQEIKKDPEPLMRWLYEHQGEMRFDASNRLFLILISTRNYFESWKLKRARPLLTTRIKDFIAQGRGKIGREIVFKWKDEEHKTFAGMLVIEHDA